MVKSLGWTDNIIINPTENTVMMAGGLNVLSYPYKQGLFMKVPTGAVISQVNYVKDLADNEVDNSFEVIPDIYVPVPDNNVLLFFNSRIETVFGYEAFGTTVYFHSVIFSVYPTVDISLNEFTLVFLSSTDEWSDLDSNSAYNYFYSIK